jgi:ADP-ribose pyrophosphatase YjhB (NUDIX family)
MILNEMFDTNKIRKAAGCLIVAKSTGRFCLNHRSQYVSHPNTWGCWGGQIDPGEDAQTAAKREMAEESGYSGPAEMIPISVFVEPTRGHKYYIFLAVIDEEFEPELNWESKGFCWVEYGDWPTPLHPGLKPTLSNQASQEQMLKFANKTIDEDQVNEILQMADSGHSDDFMNPSVERMLRSMLKYERFQNYDLPGFPDITVTYITLSGSKQRRAVVLDDEDEFVVSISFSEQMLNHKKALVASTIWTHPSYRGKNLTANIYQMLSKELDVVIVSDDTHWPGAVAIWTRKLPEMGEYVVPLFIDPDTGAAHVSGGDPYEDHRLRWAFKTGVKNLQQYLKSTDIEHKQVTEFTIDVIEDFTQRAKPGSRPGSLKRKAGKGKDEKITASDLKRLKSRANRMKQSDNAETRKRGVQLARQVSWYRNFHK